LKPNKNATLDCVFVHTFFAIGRLIPHCCLLALVWFGSVLLVAFVFDPPLLTPHGSTCFCPSFNICAMRAWSRWKKTSGALFFPIISAQDK